MNRKILALACILPLAGCGNLASIGASLTPAVLSAETAASLRTWCQRGQPLLDIARGQTLLPAASEIAEHVAPYCTTLLGGTVPATTDGNTPSWLPKNLLGLAAALGLSMR